LDTLFALRDSTKIVIALTADHGVAPFPEVHSGRYPNQGAGYVNLAGFSEYVRQALPRHGVDTTAWRFAEGVLYLDKPALRAGGLDPDSLARAFAANAKSVPGVARADLVATLAQRDTVHDFIARRWFHMFPSDLVAAEMVITLKPYWYWGDPGGSASHGSVYDYDAWVPIIFYGRPFKPGHYGGVARVVDMAPTLAAVLGVRPSEPLDGHVLAQVLRASERAASTHVAAAR
jgi:arylsulfatase A-like enzyme